MWGSITCMGILFLRMAYCGCPIMNQYGAAQKQNAQIQALQNSLYAAGDSTGFTDAGSLALFNKALPNTIAQTYNLSSTLILAEQTSQNLNPLLAGSSLKLQQNCVPKHLRCPAPINCDETAIYRTINGECNSLTNPHWGAAFSPFSRIGKADYSDGIHAIRQSVVSGPLPSARIIANVALQTSANPPNKTGSVNFHWLTVGEMLVLDMNTRQMTQTDSGGLGLRCCTADSQMPLSNETYAACYPIPLPADDPIASQFNRTCAPYIRSQTTFGSDCSLSGALPANKPTHFMDLSNVYGSQIDVTNSMRTFVNGLINITNGVMPQAESCPFDLFNCYFGGAGNPSIGNPTMSLLHSGYYRLHNNVAKQLSNLNPHWKDEKLFNEARRIVVGIYQHLLYDEWLPLLFDRDFLVAQGILCDADQLFCNEYDPTVNPSVLTEYSSGALPQFHANIPANPTFYDENHEPSLTFNIANYSIGPVILETMYNDALRGLIMTPLSYGKYSDMLRNNLFASIINPNIGMDLLSDDIHRGRDHGHNPYHYYKNLCTPNAPVNSWSDLEGVISDEHIALLQTVYQSVFDLDLFVGILLESRNETDYAGPVGQCLLVEQFKRSQLGDRFFYSFENGPYPFTSAQMKFIRSYTFGQHYCNNVNISQSLPSTLELPSESNPFTDCSEFPALDLSAWKESILGVVGESIFNFFTNSSDESDNDVTSESVASADSYVSLSSSIESSLLL